MYNFNMVYKLAIASLIFSLGSASASTLKSKEFMQDPNKMKSAAEKEMQATSTIPGTNFVYATTKSGERFIVSDNGRYVITGQFRMVDTWAGKNLLTHKDIQEGVNYPMDGLKPKLDNSSLVKYGVGKKYAYIFVDPLDKKSQALVRKLTTGSYKDFTFNFVYFPAISKESLDAVMAMHCLDDKRKLSVLMSGKVGKISKECNYGKVQQTDALRRMLGFKEVPYAVFHDGSHKVVLEKNIEKVLNAF